MTPKMQAPLHAYAAKIETPTGKSATLPASVPGREHTVEVLATGFGMGAYGKLPVRKEVLSEAESRRSNC